MIEGEVQRGRERMMCNRSRLRGEYRSSECVYLNVLQITQEPETVTVQGNECICKGGIYDDTSLHPLLSK